MGCAASFVMAGGGGSGCGGAVIVGEGEVTGVGGGSSFTPSFGASCAFSMMVL